MAKGAACPDFSRHAIGLGVDDGVEIVSVAFSLWAFYVILCFGSQRVRYVCKWRHDDRAAAAVP